MEVKVTNFTDKGKCSNCGQCCSRTLPISDKDKEVIREYIRLHGIEQSFSPEGSLITNPIDFTCPFRNWSERKCNIYEVRPEICRSFLCSYWEGRIMSNKAYYLRKYGETDLRQEFYGQKSFMTQLEEEKKNV